MGMTNILQAAKKMKILEVISLIVILSCQAQTDDVGMSPSSSSDTTPQLYTDAVESTTDRSQEIRCRNGWVLWQEGKSCYREDESTYFSNVNLTAAEDRCRKQSGHLVTITSAAEEEFICRTKELYTVRPALFWSRRVLIGLRMSDSGEWQWTTGEEINYTNWNRVPTNPQHRCAYLAVQCQWLSLDCNEGFFRYGSVCETSALEYMPSSTKSNQRVPLAESTDDPTPSLSTLTHNLQDATSTYISDDIPADMDNGQGDNIILYALLPMAVVILSGVTGLICRVRKRKLARANEESREETLELSPILASMLPNDEQVKLRDLLLHRSTLEIGEIRGRGAFGIVYKGRYSPDSDALLAQTVAIKALPDICSESGIRGLVAEAVLMADFNHAHVMSIIGVCIDPCEGLPQLVMPYMDNGDLNSYLRRFIFEQTNVMIPDEKQLLLFCLHIARGMDYLAGLKFIHRDLAARNCMVDTNLVVKVADFGLSRDVYTSSYYRQDEQKMLPVKWMSLESLQYGVFTSHSDIWSYGVTMWEVLSLGRIPYPELDNNVMLKNLEVGVRLIRPTICPEEIYTIMSSCWLNNAEERPTFSNIANELLTYLSRMCDYLELDIAATKATRNEPRELLGGTNNAYTCTGDNSEVYYGENRYIENDGNVSVGNGHNVCRAKTGKENLDTEDDVSLGNRHNVCTAKTVKENLVTEDDVSLGNGHNVCTAKTENENLVTEDDVSLGNGHNVCTAKTENENLVTEDDVSLGNGHNVCTAKTENENLVTEDDVSLGNGHNVCTAKTEN